VALVAAEDFASYLRRDLDEYDGYTAQLMLDGAIEAVVGYCGWHIAPSVTETVVLDGSGLTVQTLPSLNVTEISDVSELGNAVGQVDWSTYGVMEKRNGGLWTDRRRGIAVTLTHGFAATPTWIVTMVCAMAGRAFLGSLGVIQEAAGGESATYHATSGAVVMLPNERTMLNRLRLPEAV
jgi:hypothetical protein